MATAAGATARASGLAGKIAGLRAAKAAFQALPEICRRELMAATSATAAAIADKAKARILASPSVQTRNLYNHINWAVTKTNGRARVGVGTGSTTFTNIATRQTVRVKGVIMSKGGSMGYIDTPSRRAHYIEFGTKRAPAEPFMLPSAKSEEQPFVARCMGLGPSIEREVAAIGMRGD